MPSRSGTASCLPTSPAAKPCPSSTFAKEVNNG
uniref:Uncharacterized protein n=1 Tax=Pseudomonas phage KV2023 TaxID=3234047 RepID=A0AB39C6X6_9CAUD